MSKQVGLERIFAVVTNNPSTMLSLCRLLKNESAAIQGIAGCLLVFNLIVKDILKHPEMDKVVKTKQDHCQLLSASHFWHEHLRIYAAQHGIKHNISTYVDTRWYSMAKVCLSVQAHAAGFAHCLAMMKNRSINTPKGDIKDIIPILESMQHFLDNKSLVKILCPVVNAIGRLEFASTNLGDIWKELLVVQCYCRERAHFRPSHLSSRVLSVTSFPTSCPPTQKSVMGIAQEWGFKKGEVLSIKEACEIYYSDLPPYNSLATQDAFQYWTQILAMDDTAAHKRFCCILFQVVVHAAGVEGVFSMMGATKTKQRNRMQPSTLKPHSGPAAARFAACNDLVPDEHDMIGHMNDMLHIDNLEEFEEGADWDQFDLINQHRETAFMETLFDFNMVEQVFGETNT
ncbi:hypothetical protein DFS34DRAFT_691891 [Phlyctochytrium arcticum]|nr:hypothetical protein DFS34DRAFT_691891 [Phlyctochytrium arcticum]